MNSNDLSAHIADPGRLAALRAVALLDTPTEESFDRLTRLACRFLNAPVSLVSLIDRDRQFFKSCRGLPEPWLSRRETPLSHSFCQYNRVASRPLLVEDARLHPLFRDNPAIADLQVIAYLGIPLIIDDYVLGSFCVIDSHPRQWSQDDVDAIQAMAAAVMTEIRLRAEVAVRLKTEEDLRERNNELLRAYAKLQKQATERIRAAEQLRDKDRLLIQQSRLAAMGEVISNIAHQWRQPLNMLALLAQELQLSYEAGTFKEGMLKSNTAKMLEVITYLSTTIDGFRNFFSPSREKVRFRIREVVDKSLALLDAYLKNRQIRVAIHESAEAAVDGYPNEYSQVLLNILLNAKDAFEARGTENPVVSIEIGTDRSRSVVTISDNAGGIPDGIIDRIFEPYFTTKGPESGTGIGLYMAKMIIEKNMGGSLTACNTPEGAQFRVAV